MKKLLQLFLFCVLPFLALAQNTDQKIDNLIVKQKTKQLGQVTIGSSTFDGSAILTLTATDKGLLIPRLTTAERDAIGTPTTGLMIYNSDDGEFQFFDGSWGAVGGATADSSFIALEIDTVKRFNNNTVQFIDSTIFQEFVRLARNNNTADPALASVQLGNTTSGAIEFGDNATPIGIGANPTAMSFSLNTNVASVFTFAIASGPSFKLFPDVGSKAVFQSTIRSIDYKIGSNSLIGAGHTFITRKLDNSTELDRFIVENRADLIDAYFINVNGVGINTDAPLAMLHSSGINATGTSDAFLVEDNVGTDLMLIQNDGLIAIGHGSPTAPLDIRKNSSNIIAEFRRATTGAGVLRILSFGTPMLPSITSISETPGQGFLSISAFDTGDDVLTADKAAFQFRVNKNSSLNSEATLANLFMIQNNLKVKLLMDVSGQIVLNTVSSDPIGQPKKAFDIATTASNALLLRNADVTIDGNLRNSPNFLLRSTYDSDPTGGITSADFDAQLQTIVTLGGATEEGRLAFSIQGGEAMNIDQTHKMTLMGIDATGGNDALLVEDNVGTDLMIIENAGDVGIGITDPLVKLHIKGSSSADMLRIDNTAGSARFTITDLGRVNVFGKLQVSSSLGQAQEGTTGFIFHSGAATGHTGITLKHNSGEYFVVQGAVGGISGVTTIGLSGSSRLRINAVTSANKISVIVETPHLGGATLGLNATSIRGIVSGATTTGSKSNIGFWSKVTGHADAERNVAFYSEFGNWVLGAPLADAHVGDDGTNVLMMSNGIAPTTDPSNSTQLYVNDWNGASTAALHIRGEEGITHVFGSDVGIGFITPTVKLHVRDDVGVGVALMQIHNDRNTVNSTNILGFSFDNSVNTEVAYACIAAEIRDNTSTSEDGDLAFKVIENGSLTERMTLFSTGNLGLDDSLSIGLNHPADGFRLHVFGNVRVDSTISTPFQGTTLGAAATTFEVFSNLMIMTGDGGGNTISTITAGKDGTLLTIIFNDANITITDDNSHAANTVDLSAAFTGADDTTLQIVFDGTSWYEISRSTN